jgi:hypothetical protein
VTDNVIRFTRRKGQPPKPDLPSAHQSLHRRTQQAAPGARDLAAEQSRVARERYAAAQNRQEEERLLREGRPIPARITMALDVGGHEGPGVDITCGTVEPAVDLWECGVEVPAAEQVKLLAALTGFPVRWFYEPLEPGPQLGPVWMCGDGGCQLIPPNVVDGRGVLHYGGEPPRTPPAEFQGALF